MGKNNQPISRHQHAYILGAHESGASNREIARKLGVHDTTVLRYAKQALPAASDKTQAEAPKEVESDERNGDERTVKKVFNRKIKTLAELAEVCEIDTSEWEIYKWKCVAWQTGMKNKHANKPFYSQQFSVSASMRLKRDAIAARDEIKEIKEFAKLSAHKPQAVKRISDKITGNMLEINIPDLHAGKLAWGVETGGPNYDTKIAERTFWNAFNSILERSSHYEYDEILFVVGNDLLQSDTPEGVTYKGTAVSCDGRYQKTFRTVREMISRAIEVARTKAKRVKVVMVSGNHDKMSVWHLGDSLECLFAKYDDVEIDNSPLQFKFHRFGKVMLMLTHGDKGRRKDYGLLMATQRPEMFGATLFREAHIGHTHETKLDEKHGVRVRTLSALCPADDWHAENGFVGNQRNAEGFTWNKDEGMINVAVYSEEGRAA